VATNNGGRGCLATGCLTLILIFVPLVGHIILTLMILGDDLSASEKFLWLVVIWLIPFLGPFLYLLLGQRRDRVFGPRAV
jgi:phospholipase D-like protein